MYPGPGELEEEAYYERLILKRVEMIEQYLIGGRVVRDVKKDLGRKYDELCLVLEIK